MATVTKQDPATMSIYQKLAQARLAFLNANVKKTGINTQAEFDYFELSDIVPIATKILADHGLLFVVTFPEGVPTGTLYDFNSDKTLVFLSAKTEGELLTIKGNKIMMEIQGEGAKQTYHRRYLYMQMLDIVEQDAIDGSKEGCTPVPTPAAKATPAPAKKAPVSEAKRAEIKQEVTDSKGLAEAIQIKQLKTALAELNRIDPSQEEFIQQIVVKTENFTTLTKEKCTQLILKVGELIDECKQGVVEE